MKDDLESVYNPHAKEPFPEYVKGMKAEDRVECKNCFRMVQPLCLSAHQRTGRCTPASPDNPLVACERCGSLNTKMFQHQRTAKCKRLTERRALEEAKAKTTVKAEAKGEDESRKAG